MGFVDPSPSRCNSRGGSKQGRGGCKLQLIAQAAFLNCTGRSGSCGERRRCLRLWKELKMLRHVIFIFTWFQTVSWCFRPINVTAYPKWDQTKVTMVTELEEPATGGGNLKHDLQFFSRWKCVFFPNSSCVSKKINLYSAKDRTLRCWLLYGNSY